MSGMGNVKSSWLVGSAYIPTTTLDIDGSLYAWPAGYYYLRHPTAALSMIDTLQGILATAAINGASVVLLKNRKVRVSFDPGFGFTFSWPTSLLRNLFGFTTDIGVDESQVAEGISPLLWSPGKTESPSLAPLGCLGQETSDTQFSTSPDGIQFAREHNSQVINSFDWSHVPMDRFQTSSALGGEYTVWFKQVFRAAQKAYLYREIVENEDSTDPVTWTDYPLGPYGYRPSGRGGMTVPFSRTRGLTSVDRMVDMSTDVIVVPEWGA